MIDTRFRKLLVVSVNVICCFLLYSALKKPDCALAQPQCIDPVVPLVNNVVKGSMRGGKQAASNNSENTLYDVGCWHYCAVDMVYGVDNGSTKGFNLIVTPNHPTTGAGCPPTQMYNTLYVGEEVDLWGVRCFRLN